ncbi:hypothetical protein [Microcoleus sp. POL10_C6]|jgi:hypothetical protein|uniref:hypothetical protein n=1 Tax=Microcoleus sp. POL10_C6 TaxID=2818852 RepID=UPI002FCFF8CD
MIIKARFAIALFTLGPTKTKYTDMLGYVLELWQRFASPKTLDSMLDFFDVLVLYPCPSLETRNFCLLFLNYCGAFPDALMKLNGEYFAL